MSFTPTDEQVAVVDAFRTGNNMVITAGAGAGKTSTLKLIAKETDAKGVYVAYNKAIATDARRSFPRNVRASTAHSLAWGATGVKYAHRLDGPRVNAFDASKILGCNPLSITPEIFLTSVDVARLVASTVRNYCYSAQPEVGKQHVWVSDTLKPYRELIANVVLPYAQKAWADISSLDGRLRFEHDHYLKLWSMSGKDGDVPDLRCDFVLLDEAQDANPVIAQIVEGQDAQKILVGDQNQAIYGWRGAVDAMTTFACEHRLQLSKSFRFGQAIADEANKWLGLLESDLRIEGFEAVDSKVARLTTPDTVLCRTNVEAFSQLIGALARGESVAFVGGTGEIKRFAEAADQLMTPDPRTGKIRRVSHPDLMGFSCWADVQTYVQTDEGSDLRTMVNLIDDYGVAEVLEIAAATTNEESADLIVSTAHKSKGREWDQVKIAEDFRPSESGELPAKGEMMLAYVAVTRAKNVLDNGGLAWVNDLVQDRQDAAELEAELAGEES